jgi:hypothetical protein
MVAVWVGDKAILINISRFYHIPFTGKPTGLLQIES